jgi:hypothetical protein
LFTLFQRQVSHHRIEIDRMSAAAEDIVTVKVDMLPSDRRDFFREWPLLSSFLGRLILVHQQARIAPACKSPKPSSTQFSAVLADNPYYALRRYFSQSCAN